MSTQRMAVITFLFSILREQGGNFSYKESIPHGGFSIQAMTMTETNWTDHGDWSNLRAPEFEKL